VPDKKCPRCAAIKPLFEFPKNKGLKDGRSVYCAACMKEAHHAHYLENKAKFLDEQRARRARCPDILKARSNVGYALAKGRMNKPDACQKCGARGKVEAHHNDYSMPLQVDWLCRSCHSYLHWDERVPA
jgi:hypothetical protein